MKTDCENLVAGGFCFFSSRRRHTRYWRDWSSDVCSSDLTAWPSPPWCWASSGCTGSAASSRWSSATWPSSRSGSGATPATAWRRPGSCSAGSAWASSSWPCSRGSPASDVLRSRRTAPPAKINGVSDPRAGQPAQPSDLIDVASLVTAYYTREPDPAEPAQQVAFGTSGHRGSAFDAAFNEAHILATTQAICEYRAAQGYDGPLFLGRDTHAL